MPVSPQTILEMKGVTSRDIESYYRKSVLLDFTGERISNPRKKAEEVARELDISLPTICRYRKMEGFTTNRKMPNYSPEQKQAIAAKSQATKRRNRKYREELQGLNSRIDSNEIDYPTYSRELADLTGKYGLRQAFGEGQQQTPGGQVGREPGASRGANPIYSGGDQNQQSNRVIMNQSGQQYRQPLGTRRGLSEAPGQFNSPSQQESSGNITSEQAHQIARNIKI